MGKDIAIDLGTCNVRVFVPNKGLVINEPSVIAVDKSKKQILAVGNQAYKMLGKTCDRVSVLYPLSTGVISDFLLVEQMIKVLINRAVASSLVMPRVISCISGNMTKVEKMAVVNSITTAGFRKVCLMESPIASAIGASIDIFNPHGTLIVDIGGGTTDVAVISLGGVAVMKSIKVAGQTFDQTVTDYISKKYRLLIGQNTSERVKKEVGIVHQSEDKKRCIVKGRNTLTGLPEALEISSDELLEDFSKIANQIVNTVVSVLEECPAEMVGDILADGITLTGGGAYIRGFDKLIKEKTKLEVKIANRPELSVILGAGAGLKHINDFQRKKTKINPIMAQF